MTDTIEAKRARLQAARSKITKAHGGRTAVKVLNAALSFLDSVIRNPAGNLSDKFRASELVAKIYELDSAAFVTRYRAAAEATREEKSAVKVEVKRMTAEEKREQQIAEKNQTLADTLAVLKGGKNGQV